MVSDRFRFIYVLIPKNASSTLRAELRREMYGIGESRYCELDAERRANYFTFAFLRRPVSRFLSAYQEISMRFEGAPSPSPARAFFTMEDGPERFSRFVDAAEHGLWDDHIRLQSEFLSGARVDFIGRLERFQADLAVIFARLGIEPCPILPKRRSREDRKQRYRYSRFLVEESDLDAATLARIERLLARDIDLYGQPLGDDVASAGGAVAHELEPEG